MLVRHRPPETPIFLGEFHEEKIAFIPLHTEKSYRNLIKSNRNQIAFTICWNNYCKLEKSREYKFMCT